MDRASAAWLTETPRQRPRPGSLWPARRRARRPVVPRRLQLRPLLGTPTAQGLRSAGTLTLRARQPASKAPRMATSSSGSSAPTSDSTARQLPAASFFRDSSSSSVYPLSPLAVTFSIFCSTATVD
uniref:Uncharacterized protein n=1 Tax=Setaria viridis TaxID=4556 RepID=A0A4U6U923_SETVI|nr:hypothetical protein SEVIR_6G156200v2 [Setaria viridis]